MKNLVRFAVAGAMLAGFATAQAQSLPSTGSSDPSTDSNSNAGPPSATANSADSSSRSDTGSEIRRSSPDCANAAITERSDWSAIGEV